ncbi:hypothetical protein BG006_005559, partial [Podila minutissima]
PHQDPTLVRFWDREQKARPHLSYMYLHQLRLFGIRDGVLDKYCTWFPGVRDIHIFEVDEEPEISFDSLSSVDESDNERLPIPPLQQHERHQNQAEAPQASVTQVQNVQLRIGSGQGGRYKQTI